MTKDNKKNIKKKSRGAASAVIIASLAYLVLGIIMIIIPDQINNVICYILGAVLTVYGLFNIISFFLNNEDNMYPELIVGIIATAFGIFALFTPDIIRNIVSTIIGIVIVIDSFMDVKKSFQLKALGMKRWWIAFLVSALIIIFGLCTLFLPHFFGNMLMIVLGIALVYEGLSGFVIVALISRYSKRSEKEMIPTEGTEIE